MAHAGLLQRGDVGRQGRPVAGEDAPWDAKVMQVGDPFGNKLRFSESNTPGPRP